jgi:hypothetical protein
VTGRGVEYLTVLNWAVGRMQDDTVAAAAGVTPTVWAGRVHADLAPTDTAYPLAVVSVGDPLAIGGTGTTDWFALCSLTVRLTTTGTSYQPLVAPWRAAFELLAGNHETDVAATGGQVYTARRTTGLAYAETARGLDFRHYGAVFDVYAG